MSGLTTFSDAVINHGTYLKNQLVNNFPDAAPPNTVIARTTAAALMVLTLFCGGNTAATSVIGLALMPHAVLLVGTSFLGLKSAAAIVSAVGSGSMVSLAGGVAGVAFCTLGVVQGYMKLPASTPKYLCILERWIG